MVFGETPAKQFMPVGVSELRPVAFAGSLGPLLSIVAEFSVTATAEIDTMSVTAAVGYRTGASQGLNGGSGWETIPMVTELNQQGRSQEGASTGQRTECVSIRVRLEERGQLPLCLHSSFKYGVQGVEKSERIWNRKVKLLRMGR